jgi:hypothetical protein
MKSWGGGCLFCGARPNQGSVECRKGFGDICAHAEAYREIHFSGAELPTSPQKANTQCTADTVEMGHVSLGVHTFFPVSVIITQSDHAQSSLFSSSGVGTVGAY